MRARRATFVGVALGLIAGLGAVVLLALQIMLFYEGGGVLGAAMIVPVMLPLKLADMCVPPSPFGPWIVMGIVVGGYSVLGAAVTTIWFG